MLLFHVITFYYFNRSRKPIWKKLLLLDTLENNWLKNIWMEVAPVQSYVIPACNSLVLACNSLVPYNTLLIWEWYGLGHKNVFSTAIEEVESKVQLVAIKDETIASTKPARSFFKRRGLMNIRPIYKLFLQHCFDELKKEGFIKPGSKFWSHGICVQNMEK